MKSNARVLHVNLTQSVGLKGRQLPKTIFDAVESVQGINMSLCPAGVLCRLQGTIFVIPYSQCGTIVLDQADA